MTDENVPPKAFTLAPTSTGTEAYTPTSGNRTRVLVGRVADPLFGEVEAKGYVDVSAPTTSAIEADSIEGVRLKLWGQYRYGDTTATTELTVKEMSESWRAAGRRTDTTLTAGTTIVSGASFSPASDRIEITLPDSWIETHSELLLSGAGTFNSDFHGFELSAPDGKLVRGFVADSSAMVLSANDTTYTYEVSRQLVTTRRLQEPDAPEGRRVVQGATGPGFSLSFDLTADSIASSVLSRFKLVVPVDRSAMDARTPAGFQRPYPEQLSLLAVQPDGNRVRLETGEPSEDGSAFVFDSPQLASALQDVLLGKEEVDHFLVTGSVPPSIGLDPALVVGHQPGKRDGPHARLTIVPTAN